MNDDTRDDIDLKLIALLQENALRSHKEIGELIHMTGQAVGARIRKLQDLGIIEGYTIRTNSDRLGRPVHALITVFMKSHSTHASFQHFVQQDKRIEEAHRVSGEGCYWIRVRLSSQSELSSFLDELLVFGNYKISQAIDPIKLP